MRSSVPSGQARPTRSSVPPQGNRLRQLLPLRAAEATVSVDAQGAAQRQKTGALGHHLSRMPGARPLQTLVAPGGVPAATSAERVQVAELNTASPCPAPSQRRHRVRRVPQPVSKLVAHQTRDPLTTRYGLQATLRRSTDLYHLPRIPRQRETWMQRRKSVNRHFLLTLCQGISHLGRTSRICDDTGRWTCKSSSCLVAMLKFMPHQPLTQLCLSPHPLRRKQLLRTHKS
mmetsp:Transcript_125883/g.231029  ORF Transcript_125883/g.231029 Transcript_125883/m.231029 type:complete len:230 (+) Transcript_125883:536-1225(+)